MKSFARTLPLSGWFGSSSWLGACSSQGEGERCDQSNGSADCASGLQCSMASTLSVVPGTAACSAGGDRDRRVRRGQRGRCSHPRRSQRDLLRRGGDERCRERRRRHERTLDHRQRDRASTSGPPTPTQRREPAEIAWHPPTWPHEPQEALLLSVAVALPVVAIAALGGARRGRAPGRYADSGHDHRPPSSLSRGRGRSRRARAPGWGGRSPSFAARIFAGSVGYLAASGRNFRRASRLSSGSKRWGAGRRAPRRLSARRVLFYADLTATGRFVHFVEAWLSQVRPYYANTHTAVSSTGRVMSAAARTSARRHSSRGQRRRRRRRGVRRLGRDRRRSTSWSASSAFASPSRSSASSRSRRTSPKRAARSVFVGPYEHHSNQLPWIESIATVVEIALDERGCVSLADLEQKLARLPRPPAQDRRLSRRPRTSPGCSPTCRASPRRLHRDGAFAVFDYAASAPYVPIDMHPADPDERIDALFVSPHKFMGGPNASGVLVAQPRALPQRAPRAAGRRHRRLRRRASSATQIDYVNRLDEREEGGTPSIIGDLRAGVAFLLEGDGRARAHPRARDRARRDARIERLARHPRIRRLRPDRRAAPRHPFVQRRRPAPRLRLHAARSPLRHPEPRRLLVRRPLRAPPARHRARRAATLYRAQIARGVLGIKPGWVRVSLPYYGSDAEIEFVLSRDRVRRRSRRRSFCRSIASAGATGLWRHIERPMRDVQPIELTAEALGAAVAQFDGRPRPIRRPPTLDLDASARATSRKPSASPRELEARYRREPPTYRTSMGDAAIDPLIWFRFVNGRCGQSRRTPADGGAAHPEFFE